MGISIRRRGNAGDRETALIEDIYGEKIRGCSYRGAARPTRCPLTDSDEILRRSEMSRCANASFDHFIGSRQQAGGNVNAERSGGLEVDDQFELGRCLYRQVGGLFALENAIDIGGASSEQIT